MRHKRLAVTDWMRARRAGWCGGLALALALTAGLAPGRLPSLNVLYRYSEGAPFRLVLPTLIAVAILTALISPTPRADFTSTRMHGRDLTLALTLALACILAGETVLFAVHGADVSFTLARNVLGLLGVGLVGRALLPAAIAPLVPLAWMIPTLTLARPEGDLIAWPLLVDAADPRGIIAAATLLVLGIVAEYIRSHLIAQREP